MATTYITLVNDLLRRMNEVTLAVTGDGFSTAKNVQAIAKDAINNSIREILQDGHQFPFLKKTHSQTLTAGTKTYDFPEFDSSTTPDTLGTSSVDWDTFYINELTDSNNTAQALPVISFEQYTKQYRTIEDASGTSGRNAPSIVYQTADLKFGVTPVPDASYIIDYVYYCYPEDLVLFSDTMIIPDRFKYIIIDGAMIYMMRFRSNEQSAQIHQQKYEEGMKVMRRLLLDDPINIRSTMINRTNRSTNMLSLGS
jgi:hypothetical protein